MTILSILLSLSTPIIGVAVVIYLLATRGKKSATPNPDATAWYLQQRNQEWLQFIEYYDGVAKTPEEKQLVRHMLYDAVSNGAGYSNLANEYQAAPAAVSASAAMPPAAASQQPTVAPWEEQYQPPQASYVPVPSAEPVNNAALLLYFGAFLFVASVGLFISFGGASGVLRTFAVLAVMAVMYGGGLWLFKTRPKLQQAGVAFAAIGIVIAPLAGLAAYQYILDKQNAPLVWMLTSVFCLALYTHALISLRKPLISYLLVFTFLSLFESGVSVVSAPLYYFGWGLAFVGIGLQILSRWRGYYADLRDASQQSGMLLLPVALVTALTMIPSQGSAQFGVSLLLATVYYGLEAFSTKGTAQQINAIVSQLSAIGAVYALAYPIWHSWVAVGLAVLVVNAVQIVGLVLRKGNGVLERNVATVLISSAIVGVIPVVMEPNALIAAATGLVLICAAVYVKQQRSDAYSVGSLAIVIAPILYGQVALSTRLTANNQAFVGFMSLLVLLGLFLWQFKRGSKIAGWLTHAELSYTAGAVTTAGITFLVDPALCLAVCLGIAATFVLMAEHTKQFEWTDVVGVLLVVPVLRTWNTQPELLLTLGLALLVLIFMSVRYRRELLRWASTLAWLLLPLGMGRSGFGNSWSVDTYVWAYVAVTAALLFSRAIARGVVLFSGKTPIAAYARSASLSYVFGYLSAAAASVSISLFSPQSHLLTTAVLGVLFVVVLLASSRIEKRQDITALLPVLAQAILLSAVRPQHNGYNLTLFMLTSTSLAALTYLLTLSKGKQAGKKAKGNGVAYYLREAALLTTFFTPLVIFFTGFSTWPMPLGLLVAGLLCSYHLRTSAQSERELAGVIITGSLLWFLGVSDVHNLQAYTHVIVANLALYAYWRAQRGERTASDQYLWAMLSVATVPLALQALNGTAGSLYGWWLLLEQVVFMLLGMAIHRRFVTLWGLYVAVGAVLFQLRHLGWAALTILAMFLIGLAIYQLQKHNDQN